VELIVLGAAPAYTDRRGSASSSYLLMAGGAGEGAALLLDIGQGSYANLAATIEPGTLSAILVSHLHPDHFVDLVPLRHYLKWEFDPSRRVRVLAPAGLTDRLDALDGHPGFAAAALEVERLSEGVHRIGPFHMTVRRVDHTEESYAFRVGMAAEAAGLVYSGDCARV
jgi:ribonuclease BN (tRNA processing enzyme)